MVDTVTQDKTVSGLLDWLATFKGFYNKLTLLSANSAYEVRPS